MKWTHRLQCLSATEAAMEYVQSALLAAAASGPPGLNIKLKAAEENLKSAKRQLWLEIKPEVEPVARRGFA